MAGKLIALMPPTATPTAGTDAQITGNPFDISGDDYATVVAKMEATTATVTNGFVWLQGSIDGATWFDLAPERGLTNTNTNTDTTANTTKRNILDQTSTSTKWGYARYDVRGINQVRAIAYHDVGASGVYTSTVTYYGYKAA